MKTAIESVRAAFRTSITARLVAGFVGVVAAALVGTGYYLNNALLAELAADDLRALTAKLALLRHHLGETPALDAVRAEPQRYVDFTIGHIALSVALRDASGSVLVAAGSHVADALAAAGPPAPGGRLEQTFVLDRAELCLRVLTGVAWLGDAARTPVEVVIALDITDRREIAARYQRRVALAVAIAVIAAALLGVLATRAGLAPLRAVARRAGSISASRLDERLPVDSVPVELRELTGAFNGSLLRLDESFRRLSQFSADLAHDLRTPLGNLLGEAQVALSRPRGAEEYQAVLASSVEELERIQRMIDGMLFLARADNVQASLAPQTFDAGAEVDRVAEYYEALAADAGVSLARAGELTLHADRALFRRAVANLVSNAIAHSPRGSEISIVLRAGHDGAAEVEVSNPGPGIPPELLARVFDRFFRADASRLDSARGSGLGLAIVRSIMQVHGGRVAARSEPGKLTTFSLIFGGPTRQSATAGRRPATATSVRETSRA